MAKLLLPIVLGGVGIVLVALAAVLGWVVVPNIIDSKIKDEVQLVEGSETWNKWKINPVPVYLDFYVFHVKDPLAVEKGVNPQLEERGPYRYSERREKVDLVVNEENDTITYTEKTTYYFKEDESYGSDRENIHNVVNTPFLIITQIVYVADPVLANVLVQVMVLFGEKFVRQNVSVHDLIFKGVQLHWSYEVLFSFYPGGAPDEFAGGRFAFYKGKNGTRGDKYEVYSGIKDHGQFSHIKAYNEEEKLSYWSIPIWLEDPDNKTRNSFCNMINGSDGSTHAPFIKKTDILPIFVSDICRSVYLTFKREVKHLDIPGYRFEFPDKFFQDPTVNGDNYCFCSSPPGIGVDKNCSGGVIRIFGCQSGAPIVTSSPHFYHSDPKNLEFVDGLDPHDELHATFIELEPNTGLMLRIDKKLQISMEVQPLPNLNYFQRIKQRFVFPAFWANEHTKLDNKNADELKSMLITPLKIIDIAKWTVVGVGAVLVVAALAVLVLRK